MARFYADENFPAQAVFALRRLGHDVLTSREAGRANQGIRDEIVLADALAAGRILLTEDRRDFIRLHNSGKPHQGIIVCKRVPEIEQYARLIDEAVASAPAGERWLLRVSRPNI